MAGLREAGFVVSERGHGGGWVLARDPASRSPCSTCRWPWATASEADAEETRMPTAASSSSRVQRALARLQPARGRNLAGQAPGRGHPGRPIGRTSTAPWRPIPATPRTPRTGGRPRCMTPSSWAAVLPGCPPRCSWPVPGARCWSSTPACRATAFASESHGVLGHDGEPGSQLLAEAQAATAGLPHGQSFQQPREPRGRAKPGLSWRPRTACAGSPGAGCCWPPASRMCCLKYRACGNAGANGGALPLLPWL